jgi:DNA-binding NtrC family response regulator
MSVEVAHDLRDAAVALGAHGPQVIVSEVFLPDGRAATFAHHVRTVGSPYAIGFIAISDVSESDLEPNGWYDAFFRKPIHVAQLPAMVRELASVVRATSERPPRSGTKR